MKVYPHNFCPKCNLIDCDKHDANTIYVGGRFETTKSTLPFNQYDISTAYPYSLIHGSNKMSFKQQLYQFRHFFNMKRRFEASVLHLMLLILGLMLFGASQYDAYAGRYIAYGVGVILSSIPIILAIKNIRRVD